VALLRAAVAVLLSLQLQGKVGSQQLVYVSMYLPCKVCMCSKTELYDPGQSSQTYQNKTKQIQTGPDVHDQWPG
jgi:hypothetical protein